MKKEGDLGLAWMLLLTGIQGAVLAYSAYNQKKTNQRQLDLAREATNYQARVTAEEVKLLQAQIEAIKAGGTQAASSTSPTIAGIKLDTKTLLMVGLAGYLVLRRR